MVNYNAPVFDGDSAAAEAAKQQLLMQQRKQQQVRAAAPPQLFVVYDFRVISSFRFATALTSHALPYGHCEPFRLCVLMFQREKQLRLLQEWEKNKPPLPPPKKRHGDVQLKRSGAQNLAKYLKLTPIPYWRCNSGAAFGRSVSCLPIAVRRVRIHASGVNHLEGQS